MYGIRLLTAFGLSCALLLSAGGAVAHHPGHEAKAIAAMPLSEVRGLASYGNAQAQWRLGYAYYYGDGVKKNYARAERWLKKAAEKNIAKAQLHLGYLYEKGGQGVKRDAALAVRWYRTAAEAGNIEAQFQLGFAYQYGRGIKPDDATAYLWYTLAAEGGDKGPIRMRDALAQKLPSEVLREADERVAWTRKHIKAAVEARSKARP